MISIPLGQGAAPSAILGPYANRHGLIAGATGTGKTWTLATIAEGFSAAGVPVFLCDVKGDLAGMARPGRGDPAPVRFVDVYGREGDPMRVPLRSFGAELLARVMQLSAVQSEILAATFAAAHGRRLDTLADLERILAAPSKEFRATRASLDSIRRALIAFRTAGADSLFGRPAFDLAALETPQAGGAGLVTILAAETLIRSPDLYAATLLWLLGELYRRAPEVGDVDRPRLVLMFDEAHLLFRDAPPSLIRRIEQTVRLIRSKGIGVYFATQSPSDIPREVAAQLGNRVQHAMRAATLQDRREIQGAADCLPINPKIRAAELIATMATGTALVSTLDSTGRPSPVDLVRMNAPRGALGTLTPAERAPFTWSPAAPSSGPVQRVEGDGTGYAFVLLIVGVFCAACFAWPLPMAILVCLVFIGTIVGLARVR